MALTFSIIQHALGKIQKREKGREDGERRTEKKGEEVREKKRESIAH